MVAATPVASSSSLRYGPNVPASLSPTTSTLAGFSADGGTTGGAVGAGVVGGTVGAGTVDVGAALPSGAPVDVGGETPVGVVESGAEPSGDVLAAIAAEQADALDDAEAGREEHDDGRQTSADAPHDVALPADALTRRRTRWGHVAHRGADPMGA